MKTVKIVTALDAESLSWTAAEHLAALAAEAIARRGRFTLVLAGGATPRLLYHTLATGRMVPAIDWSRVFVFWGDERCVPSDHDDSNYHMAREILLDEVAIPNTHRFRIPAELPPAHAASTYEQELRLFFPPQSEKSPQAPLEWPRFDLVLLGLGDDGHTASLFPESSALHETEHWVLPVYVEKLAAWRITLTPPAINAAAQIFFLVNGAQKAARVKDILAGPRLPDHFPAQLITPVQGTLTWFLDAAAAGALTLEDEDVEYYTD